MVWLLYAGSIQYVLCSKQVHIGTKRNEHIFDTYLRFPIGSHFSIGMMHDKNGMMHDNSHHQTRKRTSLKKEWVNDKVLDLATLFYFGIQCFVSESLTGNDCFCCAKLYGLKNFGNAKKENGFHSA